MISLLVLLPVLLFMVTLYLFDATFWTIGPLFSQNFPEFKQDEIKVGTFGINTTKAAKDAGLRVDFEAPRPEAPSMAAALELYLKEYSKKSKK